MPVSVYRHFGRDNYHEYKYMQNGNYNEVEEHRKNR